MPSFVIKPIRDEDFYVMWSTIVDAPVGGGDRRLMLNTVETERLNRADENGTSALWPEDGPPYYGGWETSHFLLMNGPIGTAGFSAPSISRKNMREYVERIYAGARRKDHEIYVDDLIEDYDS